MRNSDVDLRKSSNGIPGGERQSVKVEKSLTTRVLAGEPDRNTIYKQDGFKLSFAPLKKGDFESPPQEIRTERYDFNNGLSQIDTKRDCFG
jgi:hypothetical protein